ncbi:tyrosine-type recombinase/integrase [Haloferax sp. MBLA0076]|uniref:Tyrosine-type recombinase/integrase n=1 Tax=Haloferax litoreum TaxID=2666140 RepID=A0A6A8GCM5_9EURY|nr:phage integrase family protein [Haloferax sp. CBA1148]MRX20888.1 tyrosine-type recombinase/integrase [Haloferax litoreum]
MRTPQTSGRGPLGNLEEASSTYLNVLSQEVPEQTFLSHQTAIIKFVNWLQKTSDRKSSSSFNQISGFVEFLLSEEDQRPDTIHGYLYTLTNFLAYITKSSPDALRFQIATSLEEYPSLAVHSVAKEFAPRFSSLNNPSPELHWSSEAMIAYLQDRGSGTRTHAFVELLRDTKSRPGQLIELDRSDVNLENKTLSVGISKNYLVSSVGLLNRRTAKLSDGACTALRTYIEHERKAVNDSKSNPLFTTTHGRISASTLRRSFKLASEAASDYSKFRNKLGSSQYRAQVSETRFQTLTPTDVWHYAISSTLDSE